MVDYAELSYLAMEEREKALEEDRRELSPLFRQLIEDAPEECLILPLVFALNGGDTTLARAIWEARTPKFTLTYEQLGMLRRIAYQGKEIRLQAADFSKPQLYLLPEDEEEHLKLLMEVSGGHDFPFEPSDWIGCLEDILSIIDEACP
ncbi:hypothetical protein ACYPKM_01240 [Pseudomonas aeruginosa]